MIRTLVILAICSFFFSCKKKQQSFASFYDCHQALQLSKTGIEARLVGNWLWTRQSCPRTGPRPASKEIRIVFGPDFRFNVFESSTLITQGTWTLKVADTGFWQLELSAPSEYLHGRIVFCNDEVQFNDSYVDGCDNYFRKIN